MGILVSRSQSRKTSFHSCICKENLKMGIQYYAFAIVALAATASTLKCYQGSKDALKLMDCAESMTRCVNVTTASVLSWACTTEALVTAASMTDNACKGDDTLKWCVCKTEGCNSAPTQATIPAMLLVAVTTIMKVIFA